MAVWHHLEFVIAGWLQCAFQIHLKLIPLASVQLQSCICCLLPRKQKQQALHTVI